jgi:lysophospholipase L1-like esterase
MTRHAWLSVLLVLSGCATAASQTVAPDAPAHGVTVPDRPVAQAPVAVPGVQPASAHLREAARPPVPWRLVSETGKATASSGFASYASDDEGDTEWNPRVAIAPGQPQWLALPLAAPASGRLALVWNGHGLHYQFGEYGRPRTYAVQVSIDSTDGSDGAWQTLDHVTDNPVRSRVTLLDAPGARWVRLSFEDVWDGHFSIEPYVRDADVYEASAPGGPDIWLVMGDSVTSVGFDPAGPQYFPALVAQRHPGYHPILVSGGTGGDQSGDAIDRLKVALPTLPEGCVVGLCYGSNDASHGVSVPDYKARLQTAIDLIRAAGHQPVVAVLPWSLNGAIASYAQACRELTAENNLPPGPDLYTYFKDHPDELRADKVHPTDEGVKSMQRLWAEAADFRYPR